MSYITRTGNLAATPTLREGERGAYTYARVIVTADGVLQRTACAKATRESAHQHALARDGVVVCL